MNNWNKTFRYKGESYVMLRDHNKHGYFIVVVSKFKGGLANVNMQFSTKDDCDEYFENATKKKVVGDYLHGLKQQADGLRKVP